jgi:hypothetical protein
MAIKKVVWGNLKSTIKEGSDEEILHFCNSFVRGHSQGYSDINLGRASKVHPEKIRQFQDNRRELLTDDLLKVARTLDLYLKIYEH